MPSPALKQLIEAVRRRTTSGRRAAGRLWARWRTTHGRAVAAAGTAQADLAEIQRLAGQGDWEALEAKGLALLAAPVVDGDVVERVAYALQQAARLGQAARIATDAASRFPGRWLLQFLAGVTLMRTGRADEACAFLRQAVALAPTDRESLRHLVEAVARARGLDAAAAEYTQRGGASAQLVLAPVRNLHDWAAQAGVPLLDAGEAEPVPFRSPRVFGQPDDPLRATVLSNKPCVADLRDVRIFSNSSLILTADGTVLSDTAGHPQFGHITSLAYEKVVLAHGEGRVLLDCSGYATRELEAGILLSGLASSAFGHWLPEFLPKLQFLRRHPDFERLPLIVDAGMPESHFEHLRRLSGNQLVLLQAGQSLRCRRLLVAPPPTFLPADTVPNDVPVHALPGVSPRALRFLREQAPPGGPGERHRRLFLARKNMQWRRLLNEDEIARDLAGLGFETVYLEQMGVEAQIALLRQAACIVAPNGSSMLNLVFASPDTPLVVLSQPNLHNWGTFCGPMEALGYDVLFVCGDHVLAQDQKHSDYHVPAERVRAAVEFMTSKPRPCA